MAVPPTTRRTRLILTLALLAIFWIVLTGIQTDSLWFDEGYTLYIVRDLGRSSDGVVETARFFFTSLKNVAARAGADVHPPLYFLVLDVWVMLAGESVFTVRLLSVWFGMIALAATYRLGCWLFNHRAGLLALMILGTASMFVYYTREARMYTLLLALAALATLIYWRWWQIDRHGGMSLRLSIVYGIALAALAYTHYAGALIFLTHLLHMLLTKPHRIWRLIVPGIMALLLFVPWLSTLRWQFNAYGGPAAIPFRDVETALAALIFFVTGGYWGLYALPVALNVLHVRRYRAQLLLLACWLLLTPALLLIANTIVPSLFQVRYAIGILPAGALLVAGGLISFSKLFSVAWRERSKGRKTAAGDHNLHSPMRTLLTQHSALSTQHYFLLLILIVYTQLTTYPFVWSPKPPWEAVIQQVVEARDGLEPAITALPPQSPAAYYDRRLGLTKGITLDLAWRWQEPYSMAGYVEKLNDAEAVWVMMPGTYASTWDAARKLLTDRHVGYRDGVMTMVFYRFDRGEGSGLRFRFGDLLAYDGGIQHQLYAHPGEDFCFSLELTALGAVSDDYAIDLYLTQGYGTIRALTTLMPGAYDAGENIGLAPCIPVPAETPAGPHHLRMRVYNPANNEPAPVIEGEDVYWGAEVIMALVSVG